MRRMEQFQDFGAKREGYEHFVVQERYSLDVVEFLTHLPERLQVIG